MQSLKKSRSAILYDRRKSDGVCVKCGELRDSNILTCTKCTSKWKEAHNKWRQNGGDVSRSNRTKQVYKERKSLGLCVDCSIKSSTIRCEICKIKHLKSSIKYSKTDKARIKRRNVHPSIRAARNMRSRISKALRGKDKGVSITKALGCSIEFFKRYLENLFGIGMSWDNYGKWHVDHIKPLDAYDLTDPKQLLECCHYTNLQPLWGLDNILKSNKYDNATSSVRAN